MKRIIILSGSFALPLLAFAQVSRRVQGVLGGLDFVQAVINRLAIIVIALAFLYFLWGLANYILNPDDKDKFRDIMLYGIIALFVMVSIWGIINLVAESVLGSSRGEQLQGPLPQVPNR